MFITHLIPNYTYFDLHLNFSVSTRMAWAITILMVSFVSLTILTIPDSDLWQEKFLHAVILTIVASNVGVNVLQVSIYMNLMPLNSLRFSDDPLIFNVYS